MARADDANDNELKLVVRGLPFEATEDDVLQYFRIEHHQLSLPTWSDSNRCKGIAFITCLTESQKTSILELDTSQFTAGENTRELSIREFEERPKKSGRGARQRGGGRSGRGRGASAGRGRGDGASQSYKADDETSREIYVSNASFNSTKDSFMEFFSKVSEVKLKASQSQPNTKAESQRASLLFASRLLKHAILL